jgi:CBS domain-containing protein
MLADESGFAPVCAANGRLVGVVYLESLLECVADDRTVPNVQAIMSTQIPTCTLQSVLVDAVRQMIRCYLRKIPVVGDAGELVGLLTLCEAAAAAARDPAVGDVLERFAMSPSSLARRMR